MIPFNTWVKGLIEACAKKMESNVFTNVNTFQKSPVIQGTIDTSQGPQNGNNGIVSTVTFADNNNAVVGSVCATYSNTEAKGMYLKVSQGKLGIEKTDEGKYVTYSPEPKDGAGNSQIVTTGYLLDCISELDIDSLLNRLVTLENQVTALENNMSLYVTTVDNEITYNSINPVTSKGIFKFVTNLYNGLQQQINTKIREAIQESLISNFGFGKMQVLFKTTRKTFEYTPTESGILVLGWFREDANLYFKQNDKNMEGAHNYIGEWVRKGTGDCPITFPLKQGVKYTWSCESGLNYAFWSPLIFQVGE